MRSRRLRRIAIVLGVAAGLVAGVAVFTLIPPIYTLIPPIY